MSFDINGLIPIFSLWAKNPIIVRFKVNLLLNCSIILRLNKHHQSSSSVLRTWKFSLSVVPLACIVFHLVTFFLPEPLQRQAASVNDVRIFCRIIINFCSEIAGN